MASNTITISKSNAKLTITMSMGALVGLLLGGVLFSRAVLSPSSVPPAALKAAYTAGSAILQGTAPDSLPMDVFTETFMYRFQIDYEALVRPMSTADIIWTGTPVVTWTGNNYIDVCLIANTQAGTLAIEMRVVRNEDTWAVDQLLSLQLREAK
ncbi:MAG TPA: hypothetical protein VF352_08525 [Anaerolineales bacterium]